MSAQAFDHPIQYHYSNNGNVTAAFTDTKGSTSLREDGPPYGHYPQHTSFDPQLLAQRNTQHNLVSSQCRTLSQSSQGSESSTESSQFSPTTLGSSQEPNVMASITTGNASKLKRTFVQAMGRASANRKLTGELDPENQDILRLRQEESKSFEDIAHILNDKRLSAGLQPNLSANAVYSRYKRNGPLIAAAAGKVFKPTELDKTSKHSYIKFREVEPIVGFNAGEDELLVKAYQHIQSNLWQLVANYIEHDLGGAKHDPKMCARRYDCL